MPETDDIPILRRLTRGAAPRPADRGLTAGRVLRLAAGRATERALGLRMAATAAEGPVADLDDALSALPAQWMLIALTGPVGLAGLAALDAEARAAVIELQTIGRLRDRPAEARPITPTDAALALPLIDLLLRDLAETAEGTTLAGWTAGCEAARRLDGPAAAALVLPEARYLGVRLTLDFGVGARQGGLHLMLPVPPAYPDPDHVRLVPPPWKGTLRRAVLAAPSDLRAVLGRIRLPVTRIEALGVGQVLPLAGITVGSVRLEGPGGALAARARLGQAAGMRAVRIEVPAAAELEEAGATQGRWLGGPPEM